MIKKILLVWLTIIDIHDNNKIFWTIVSNRNDKSKSYQTMWFLHINEIKWIISNDQCCFIKLASKSK